MSRERSPQRSYCLRCFATLPGGKAICATCGFATTPSMRQQFWSLAPGSLQLQRTVQTLCLLASLALVVRFAFMGNHMGTGAGHVIALPLVGYAAIHLTLDKLTRHAPGFRPVVFWSAFFFLAPLPIALIASDGYWVDDRTRLVLIVLCPSLLLAGVLVRPLARRAEAWKRRLMAGEGVLDQGSR
jgi:ribosomal protein L37E